MTSGPGPDSALGDAVPVDGSPGEDALDAVMAPPPTFVAVANLSADGVASLTFPLEIPTGTNRFLLVSVQLASDCATLVPGIVSVTYDGTAMTQAATIVGTPCAIGTTRSDQWLLVGPRTGIHDVSITLDSAALSIHSGALAFVGINQQTPIRASAVASGDAAASTVTVTSATSDLVVNTVGQGTSITAPGAGASVRFLNNVDSSNTLNNSAASTTTAAGTSTTMTWTFGGTDEWQSISSSLQP